jgi:hypothetical protein
VLVEELEEPDEPPPTTTFSMTGGLLAATAVGTGWATVLSAGAAVFVFSVTAAAGTNVGMGKFNKASTFEELPVFAASLLEKILTNPKSDVTDKDAMRIFHPFDLLV